MSDISGAGGTLTAELWTCTNREYHADVSRIGSSMLKLFRKSPAKFHRRYILGINDEETSDARMIGILTHVLALEPHLFDVDFAVAPKCDRRTTQGKADYAAFQELAAGKTVVDVGLLIPARGCVLALQANESSSMLLGMEGAFEQSVFWRDEETGVMCKARFDKTCPSINVVADIKTTGDASPEGFVKQIANLKYYRQAAWYQDGYEAMYGERPSIVLLAVETKPPFEVGCHEIDEEWLELGRSQNREDLRGIADCRVTPDWSAKWSRSINKLKAPAWALREDYAI